MAVKALPVDQVFSFLSLEVYAAELAVAAVAAAAFIAWQSRPRGWSRTDLIEVSTSPIHGRGVFAKTPIPPNTVIGSYPGRLRTYQQTIDKCLTASTTKDYVYQVGNGYFLDPTDRMGVPSKYPEPGWPWIAVDETLAYCNEPPAGTSGVNCELSDGSSEEDVLIRTVREVVAGDELYIDYGMYYDRSGYRPLQ